MKVIERSIHFEFLGRETTLNTVEVIPETYMAGGGGTTCLFRPSYGATIDALSKSAKYLSNILNTRVISYQQPYEIMLNPETEVLDIYKKTDDVVWSEIHGEDSPMDVVAPSLGALSAAVSICYSPERTKNLVLICPMGSTASHRHSKEVLEHLDSAQDIKERMDFALSQTYVEAEKKRLMKRGGKSIALDLRKKALRDPGEFYQAAKAVVKVTAKNARAGKNGLVVSRAFAVGSMAHISPELRKQRKTGKVIVIAGEHDPVFPPEEIRQTWKQGKEIDLLLVQKGIAHPSQTTKDGKKLLQAAADVLTKIHAEQQ